MESDYRSYLLHHSRRSYVFYLLLNILYWGIYTLFEGLENEIQMHLVTTILSICWILLGFLLLLKCFESKFHEWYIFYFYSLIVIDIITVYVEEDSNDVKISIQFLIRLTYPLFFGIRHFVPIIFGVVIYFIALLPGLFLYDYSKEYDNIYPYIDENLPLLFSKVLILFSTMVMMTIYGYYEEINTRINFLKLSNKRNEKKKDDEIFDNLVPKFVQNKMKTGDRGTTKEREEATIIFANIAEFDNLLAKLSPRELISLLDKIYNSFDQLCNIHGIQKIETVCYTYMAAGGIKECERDMDVNVLSKHHAVRAFELALDMVDIMSGIVLENGEKVKIKIGVHTGKVLAGVIGEHKPQFSLIGDTINTAARMGAKVEKMCILITQETYDIVCMHSDYSDCFEKLMKFFKGKGDLPCYQANPIKSKNDAQNTKMKNFKNFMTKFLQKAIEKVYGPDVGLNELLGGKDTQLEKSATVMLKQNSMRSNQSSFIKEDDDENNIYEGHQIEDYKTSLKKSIKTNPENLKSLNTLSVGKATEVNTFFRNSFLLLSFNEDQKLNNMLSNDPKSKDIKVECTQDAYKTYKIMKYLNSLSKSRIINYGYIIIQMILLFNEFEYNEILHTNYLISFLKIILILSLFVTTNNIDKLKKTHKRTLEIALIIIYTLNICLCQLEYNILSKAFYLDITMFQNLTIITVIFVSIIEYEKQFLTQIAFIIIFSMNLIGNRDSLLLMRYLSLSIVISAIAFIFLILREYLSTLNYVKNQFVLEEVKKSEELLFNLMPPHVVISLKEDRTVADVIQDVTILYTDIVNFTKFSAAQKDQSNIVRMLIELFKRMDNACVEFNVYKVHTIGDCFVVLGFTGKVPFNKRNPLEEAKNVVRVGRKMIEIIRAVRETKEVNFPTLNMRIGIHTVNKITLG